MRLVLRNLPQMLVMAGVVTTALYVPVMAVLALFSVEVVGVPLHSLVTFGEALSAVEGVAAWWIVLFIPALVYSACMMPWGARKT